MTHLPTLYKTNKNKSIQICTISVASNTFTVEWGQLGGAMQTKTTICKATNVGRSNERSPSQQATFEAQAKWDKKKKEGYSEDKSAPTTVDLPMKVKVWESKRFKPGFISTPKLNGVNGTYRLVDDKLILTSRGGEVYPPIPHLEPFILEFMHHLGSTELNGELYIPNTHLQDITSAVKKPKELSKSLQFCIFDICDFSVTPYVNRRLNLIEAGEDLDNEHVTVLTGVECQTLEDIESHYSQCMASNLEGTVIKDPTGLYRHNVRSSYQWKYKKMLDCEKQITGYTIDKNGHCVFTVSVNTVSSDTFKVKMKGTDSERLAIASKADTYIGRWLNISYETLSRDGKCLKPVGNYFRDCDNSGFALT